jgi:aminopeptidase N
LAGALSAPAAAGSPFDFDTTPGRLSKSVVPIDYAMTIKPDVATSTFKGSETIVVEARKPVAVLTLNTHDIVIEKAAIDGKAVKALTENEKQITTFSGVPLSTGRHTIAIAYSGKMESSPDGLFLQPYRAADGTTRRMVSTQFESTDARRMFPSFDEPSFRATYVLTAIVPKEWAAISNMPVASHTVSGDSGTWTFGRTPKMASYLVEFTAGDLASISASAGGVEHLVWATRGNERYGAEALERSQKILALYNDYFGYKYPLPKLAHIAVPGGFGGAMENWGAITYRQELLLVTPTTEASGLPHAYYIQAHEMAHQWFGDLVTMAWWNDLWLNESFATWMGTKSTAALNPQWAYYEGATGDKNAALNADARASSHPIQQEIKDEAQAEASFDPAITYSKGSSVLGMLEGYLGADAFRSGIRQYVKAHAYSNATAADLWSAIGSATGKPVAEIAENWISKPGYPLISVGSTCDSSGNRTLSLTQKRFLNAGADALNTVWQVPIAIGTGINGPAQYTLLTSASGTAPGGRCDEPVRVDAGDGGYYRVAYDAQLSAINSKAFPKYAPLDQIAMLDDTWALAGAGKENVAPVLALTQSLGDDFNPTVRGRVTNILVSLEENMRGTPEYPAYQAYGRAQLQPVYQRLGWDDKPGDSLETKDLRHTTLRALGYFGDTGVKAEARRRFDRFLADRSSLAPDQQTTVLAIVALDADQATYDQILGLLRTAKDSSEMQRFGGALAGVRDPKLAQETMQFTLSPLFPPEAAQAKLLLIAGVADLHPREAWDFFRQHSAELLKVFSSFERSTIVAEAVPQVFWRIDPPEVEAYLKTNVPPSIYQYAVGGMEAMMFRRSQVSRMNSQTDAYLATQPNIHAGKS